MGGRCFFPHGLKQAAWLRFYARYFSTVEVNNTFYRLPEKSTLEAWQRDSPDDFIFSVKASRWITHIRRLAEPEEGVLRLPNNASGLGGKLGVVLFQLPPRWNFMPERLESLLEVLDRHEVIPGLRAALEVRDPSWYTPRTFELLAAHGVALALADQPGFAADGPLTAPFVFVRRHGPGGVFGADYPEEALQADSARLRSWLDGGRDVYLYFNNDPGGNAVRNALRLKQLLGM